MANLNITYHALFLSSDLSFILVPIAILYYDQCLTFHVEIEHFWKGFTFTLASVLFIINRYLSLLMTLPVLVESFAYFSELRCCQLQFFRGSSILLAQGVVLGILSMRIYALYNRSRRILALLLITWAVVGAAGIWSISSNKVLPLPLVNDWHACDLSLTNDQIRACLAVAWGGVLVLDTLMFALTVARTLRSDALWRRRGLFYVILRDGAIYYATLTLANAINVTTLTVSTVPPQAKGIFATITNTVSSILISRLVLNLRVQGNQILPLQTSTYDIGDGHSWGAAEMAIDFQREEYP
ncbi:hypothetical protein CERSUDRAFT_122660 [Gelatoporia subvermispora B]|uniref:DUF6533 domain-containing protein n=1 Tax=Ceriporiopsis subvermispora (strain B) TaxID=914234 RepID=M2QQ77_CERS8|nr:hypothetical protein CERSUDRAFT_122660 [Gelatoporia subvermispora B]